MDDILIDNTLTDNGWYTKDNIIDEWYSDR